MNIIMVTLNQSIRPQKKTSKEDLIYLHGDGDKNKTRGS